MVLFRNSPVDILPYDVIREIFIHCVSTDPFRPPRATHEPMLLTQICSSWRSIALECPILWTHLQFCLKVAKSDVDGRQIIPKRQMELLRWWKGNHNSLMPHLFLETQFQRHYETQEYSQLEESLDFILAYIASAQYICVDQFYWEQIEMRINNGDDITFPYIHTLVETCNCNDIYDIYIRHPVLAIMGRITKRCPSSLRYLSLPTHYFPENTVIPSQWAALTHLSLREMQLSTTAWFTLIRSFPKLQWGNFNIIASFGPVDNIDTSTCTLLELVDIFITFDDMNNVGFRISFIFANLYLPSLCTLSIYALTESWTDIRSVAEIRTILKSTPAIATLILGPRFLNLHQPHHVDLSHSMNVIEPIWDIATRLIHLQLEIDLFTYRIEYTSKEALDIFIKNTFLSNTNTGWLSLKNPMCPIQKISIIDSNFLFRKIPDYLVSSVSDLSSEMQSISFEFTPNSPHMNAAKAWRDWH